MTLKKAFVFIVAVLPIILSALLFSFVIIFDATSLSVGFFLLGIGFCISGILLDILSISIINGAKKTIIFNWDWFRLINPIGIYFLYREVW